MTDNTPHRHDWQWHPGDTGREAEGYYHCRECGRYCDGWGVTPPETEETEEAEEAGKGASPMSNRSIPVQFSVSGPTAADVTVVEYRDEVVAFGPGQNNPSETVYETIRYTVTATLPFSVYLLDVAYRDDALTLTLEQPGDEDDADLVISLDVPFQGSADIRTVTSVNQQIRVVLTVTANEPTR